MGWENRDYNQSPPSGMGMRLPRGSVVMWLIGINAAVFFLDAVLFGSTRGGAIAPTVWGNFNVEQGVYGFQIWRWGTYQFLHAGLFHVFFNMLALYFFGPMMEQWWGSRRFLAFYLSCGVVGAGVFALALPILPGAGIGTPIVGASACVSGVIVGAAVLYPKRQVMLIFPPIPMPLWVMAVVFLGLDLISVSAGSLNAGGSAAHLGGAAFGFLLVKFPRTLDWADRLPSAAISKKGARGENFRGRGRFQKKQQKAAQSEQAVDRILDKVRQHGLQSLTRREKKALQQATDRHNAG